MKLGKVAFLLALCFFFSVEARFQTTTILSEGFENGGKTSYAAASVNLPSGSWYLEDALIGNTTSDRKFGSYSVRMRNSGVVRMNFNVSGAGTVTIWHAKYGTDGSSSWELWYSTNNGSSWTKAGSTILTDSTSLVATSFTINIPVSVRFEIRKVSGGANRINFDNITVTSYNSANISVHLTMGNPSNAMSSTDSPSNYLMVKSQYVLSYNRDYGTPNWVSWHLDSSWLGSAPRQDDFRADPTLPSGWYRAQPSDYTGSGYDRGHMCPSADRTATIADNSATFLMTNILPQTPTNNRQTWENLESYCRTLARSGNELYIISGGYGVSGYIAGGRVVIPSYTWKVIMVLPQGTNDVSRVTNSTRLIAVWVPNTNNLVSDWRYYRVSVDYVESMTGYNFFSNVPDGIENFIESLVDNY
ncbi:MAG: DNA/RNA non-specific endonuclease [Pyrinomonadaceae bacterium]|nr:DNA/RNA non-specific endonuclease [Pyrinomonadaceae bacterium]